MQCMMQSGVFANGTSAPLVDVPMAAVSYSGSATPQSLFFGFQPDWVWIKEDSTATGRMFDNVGLDAPFDMNTPDARLSSVSGFAFTARGVDLPANTANISATGQSYRAVAFKQSSQAAEFGFKVTTWTGDGTGARTVSLGSHPNFAPYFVCGRRSDSNLSAAGGETPAFWDGEATAWELGGSKQTTGFITALDGTGPTYGFDVSTALNVNLATHVGFVFGVNADAVNAVGVYAGTGAEQTINTGLQLVGQVGFLFVKRFSSASEGVWFDYTQGDAGLTTAVKPFSAVANGSGYNVSLQTSSFTLHDADAEYNAAGSNYGYIAVKR